MCVCVCVCVLFNFLTAMEIDQLQEKIALKRPTIDMNGQGKTKKPCSSISIQRSIHFDTGDEIFLN